MSRLDSKTRDLEATQKRSLGKLYGTKGKKPVEIKISKEAEKEFRDLKKKLKINNIPNIRCVVERKRFLAMQFNSFTMDKTMNKDQEIALVVLLDNFEEQIIREQEERIQKR